MRAFNKTAATIVNTFLAEADVDTSGRRPWSIQVIDERFFLAVLRRGSLGLGEAYMEGWWDCADLPTLAEHLLLANLGSGLYKRLGDLQRALTTSLVNLQAKIRAEADIRTAYDHGNDFFRALLGPSMTYSCAFWGTANNLEDAQEAKHNLVLDKLSIRSDMRFLDIGCGWGSLLRHASITRGALGSGITLSANQALYASNALKSFPIKIMLSDYRDLVGEYDRIASIGMFEHVGPENYRNFMKIAHRVLTKNGLFLLHTIGNKEPRIRQDPWFDKYIFPHAVYPSLSQITTAADGLFVVEDVQNIGLHYAPTLRRWAENYTKNASALICNSTPQIDRMWRYYLGITEGIFRCGRLHVWQIVFSKGRRGPPLNCLEANAYLRWT